MHGNIETDIQTGLGDVDLMQVARVVVQYGLYDYVKETAIYKLSNFLASLSTNSFTGRMMFEYNNCQRWLASWKCLDINLFQDIYRTSEQKKRICVSFQAFILLW